MHIILTRASLLVLLFAAGALLATVVAHSDAPRSASELNAALAAGEGTPRAGDLVLARKSAGAADTAAAADELGAANAQTSAAPVTDGPKDLRDVAREAAINAGIDPHIFVRQIQAESRFDPAARSGAGAIGIAQIVPHFHPDVDPTDPVASLRYAATLMAGHLANYGGDYAKALAAYNAGPTAVARHGGVPPYAETQNYVSKILGGQ